MNVHRTVQTRIVGLAVTAGEFRKLLAGKHSPRALRHDGEEIELVAGEIFDLALYADLSGAFIDFQAGKAKNVARGACALTAPAQDSADARQKLPRLERLCNIIVRAHFQSYHAIHRIPTRGQHDYGRRCCIGVERPHPGQEIKAVCIRQHQVENDEIHRIPFEFGQSSGPVRRVQHVEFVVSKIV